MKNTQANIQTENTNSLATELRDATSNAYFDFMKFNEADMENLVKVSQVNNKTVIRHTVQIPGIPTDTTIRFEINKDGQGLHYNVIGHYCFVPPPSLDARWI